MLTLSGLKNFYFLPNFHDMRCNIAEDVVEDVDKVAATTACLFFGYFDGATTISESCGGGGGNNELPKKKDNEDELFFALRCHQMAKTMHTPKYRLRR